ncbi:MAG: excinuclease ABC subunit UvrA [bacterium]|nr:excinuclease ABC subunit UvrA [bacterium]
MKDKIVIRGAREHNLKNIDLEIPRNKLVVITGLSGSGKSSLAFDTIYAEGQRKYVESLSAYARQFLEQLQKPDVEHIEGLSPAISIEQRTAGSNPRSTVATTTEIYDYLRLFYASIGIPHCYKCGREISSQTVQEIVDRIIELPEGSRVEVLAPVVRGRKGEYQQLLDSLAKQGYVRVRIDGAVRELSEEIKLSKHVKHDIAVVVDRLVVKPDIRSRLTDSVETSLKLTTGLVIAATKDGDTLYSTVNACVDCGISFDKFLPRMFSFNSPYGACPECHGLGSIERVDPEMVIPNPRLSLRDGAIAPWRRGGHALHIYNDMMLNALAEKYGFSLDMPFGDLRPEIQKAILYGTGKEEIRLHHYYTGDIHYYEKPFEGVIPQLERRFKETDSSFMKAWIGEFMSLLVCPSCKGGRLRPESAAVTVGGRTIIELARMSVKEAHHFLNNLKLSNKEAAIAREIIKELLLRLQFMQNVGLEYLTLDRESRTLSGGEAQRIRLATQIGAGLVGVLYILDEPSIGLHQRDNRRLLKTLMDLRDLGNTVIIVEHDETTMRSADYIVDLGPGAGTHGGYVVVAGTVEDVIGCEKSLTGKYLSGEMFIEVPDKRKPVVPGKSLLVKGARENNLKNIDVEIPLGVFCCVSGVSGSGKSTLVSEILDKGLRRILYRSRERPGDHDAILGAEWIDKAIVIDQSPIGRTPRSNPATYTGTFTPIRELFANLPAAKVRGYRPGRFSFNVRGGRCEACEGDGIKKIEMHFLPDVYVECEVCNGKRYNRDTLSIRYKGKNIHELLDMTVEEALDFFQNIPRIKAKLQTLYDVGLGYVKLGQPATTLSGGEAQRIKLSAELSRKDTGRTLYLLDEPTTGLHFDDTRKLLRVLSRLTEQGNTVVVIEHNLDVIKTADYIIDLGPEGGEEGGTIVAQGTPEEVSRVAGSYTGHFLRDLLQRGRRDKRRAARTQTKRTKKGPLPAPQAV